MNYYDTTWGKQKHKVLLGSVNNYLKEQTNYHSQKFSEGQAALKIFHELYFVDVM